MNEKTTKLLEDWSEKMDAKASLSNDLFALSMRDKHYEDELAVDVQWPTWLLALKKELAKLPDDVDDMEELIHTAPGDHPLNELFESFARVGWDVAVTVLSDAVYDRDGEKLGLIDLKPEDLSANKGAGANPQREVAKKITRKHRTP